MWSITSLTSALFVDATQPAPLLLLFRPPYLRSTSAMGGKGVPADVVALAVPMTFAATAFSFVIFRAFAYDPEWSNGITPETAEAAKTGETYRNQISSFFKGRKMSVFNNDVKL